MKTLQAEIKMLTLENAKLKKIIEQVYALACDSIAVDQSFKKICKAIEGGLLP